MREATTATSARNLAAAIRLAFVAMVLAVSCTEACSDQGEVHVEVHSDQVLSVRGRGPSLKNVVEDVCFRSGVDVVFYDAADRPFGGSFQRLPLRALLDRLLRDESFVAETGGQTADGEPRIVRLRVLGEPAVASARRASGSGRRRMLQVPPALLDTAFGAPEGDAAGRDAALAALASRISSDPVQLQGFLSTDPRKIAEAIRRYRGVEEPLRAMATQSADARVVAKIGKVLEALATLPPP